MISFPSPDCKHFDWKCKIVTLFRSGFGVHNILNYKYFNVKCTIATLFPSGFGVHSISNYRYSNGKCEIAKSFHSGWVYTRFGFLHKVYLPYNSGEISLPSPLLYGVIIEV